jgi:P2 family phage contractile tail tube protein
MNIIPEKLINFRVYLDGTDLLGAADVELPSLEYMKETVKGAGIAGEFESPVLGHTGSLSLTINWRTPTRDVLRLAAPKAHALDVRGALQLYDAGLGEYVVTPLKVVVRAIPKAPKMGKFEPGAQTDSSSEFEVIYLKIVLDEEDMVEIDKLNYICIIDGTDYLSAVRSALGIGATA